MNWRRTQCEVCPTRTGVRWDNYEQAYLCPAHRDDAREKAGEAVRERLFDMVEDDR